MKTNNAREHRAHHRNGFIQNWVRSGDFRLNRKLLAALRIAHRVLGMKREHLGLGGLGAGAVCVAPRPSRVLRSALLSAGALTSISMVSSGALAQTVSAPPYTPATANNGGQAITVGLGSNVTLTGSSVWTGSTRVDATNYSVANGYNAGYITGGIDPNGRGIVITGTQSTGVAVYDPISGGTTTVNAYTNANISLPGVGGSGAYRVYSPTPAGGGPFVGAQIANVSGGELTINLDGTIGDPTVKETVFVDVSNGGTVNWTSSNIIQTARYITEAVAPSAIDPYDITLPVTTFSGTFNVTNAGGTTSQTVTNLASLQAYNDWLIAQLQAGNFGSGAAAQAAYDAAFALAYTNTNQTWTVTPYTAPIPPTDPLFTPVGTVIGVRVDGTNSLAHITGAMETNMGSGDLVLLQASNGATIINDGTITSVRFTQGIIADSGSTVINNGVRNLGYNFGYEVGEPGNPETHPDIISGTGTTYTNNGTVNVAAWSYNYVGSDVSARWLNINSGATATNNGAVNIGTVTQTDYGQPQGVYVDSGGTFVNSTDGVIYLGRAASTDTTSAPLLRGGADVAQPNGAVAIIGAVGATVTNNGTIVIGDLVQNGIGIQTEGNGAVNIVNNGTIIVNGHYDAAPQPNIGILSTNTSSSAVVDNAGTITLTGFNGIGIMATGGGQAQSSGTIDVAGAMSATGLRNYGIWSEGQDSLVDLSGTVKLDGDGAIGVHARSGGSIEITSTGSVNFVSGSNQIGYFLYGAGSTITDSGTAAHDVSTQNSVLFRIEDGATFAGGASGSTFTASGQGSTAFVITGAPSVFGSGNVTLNLSGEDTTGVVIEGGATGTIANSATINQTGVGSIAAIVDGQKHDINGNATGTPDTTTTLTTAAVLSSSSDEVIGYIARNQGQLTNTGNIAFAGAHTTGIIVETGATATNSGNISVADGGIGIYVNGPAGGLTTTANNIGSITVNGGSLVDRTRGIVADGSQAVANMQTRSTLILNGVGAIGAEARNGGLVTLVGTATPVFNNTDQIAFHAVGAGSTITDAATAFNADGVRSTLFRIEDGATLTSSSTLMASGQDAVAVVSTGVGAQVTLSGPLNITGDGARGMIVEGGAAGTIASSTVVTLTGTNAVVGVADGQKHDLSGAAAGTPNSATTLTNQAAITAAGDGALAFIAQNQGKVVNQGVISMTGTGATGVHVLSGGTLDNSANITVANGTGIDLEGAGSIVNNSATVTANDGVAALYVHDGGGTAVGGTYVSDGTAHTILVGAGAAGLDASGVTLTSNGTGNGIENAAETAAITLANTTINVVNGAGIRTATALDPASTVTVNVSGTGTGFAFQTAAAGMTTGDLVLGSGYVINGSGAGATGILANTTGTVVTSATVTMNNAAAGSALVAGTANASLNAGMLTSISTTSPVVDLSNGTGTSFTNQGTISALDVTHTAILGSSGNDTINMVGGAIRGIVRTGDGTDQVVWTGGTLDGSIEMGAGDNDRLWITNVNLSTTYHVDGGAGAGDTLIFEGTVWRGGSFAADDLARGLNLGSAWETVALTNGTAFTLTGNLSAGAVTIDATSTLFAGNGVNPTITGAVTNGGLIDLTNGTSGPADVLTIAGNYTGNGGAIAFNTFLGDSSSATDRVVINGATSGQTFVQVNNAGGGGAQTTGNGIELIQVNGASAANAFTLGNRVAAGAYEYLLFQNGVGAAANNGNWYLRSTLEICITDPTLPACNTGGGSGGGDGGGGGDSSGGGGGGTIPIYRPEVIVDTAIPALASRFGLATLGTWHERTGGEFANNYVTTADGQRLAVWGRIFGDTGSYGRGFSGNAIDRSSEFDHHGPSYSFNYGGIQAGSDLLRRESSDGGHDVAGFYGGAGTARASVRSVLNVGFGANAGSVAMEGYSLGGYFTHVGVNGWYVDAVLQGTRYDNIRATSNISESQTLKTNGWGWVASLESGYPIALGHGFVFEPQAQLVYQSLSFDNGADAFGRITFSDSNAAYGRLSARLLQNWTLQEGRQVSAWVRTSVWTDFGAQAKTTFSNLQGLNGTTFGTDLGGSWLQVDLAVSAQLSRNASLFAIANYNHSFYEGQSWGGRAGIRMAW